MKVQDDLKESLTPSLLGSNDFSIGLIEECYIFVLKIRPISEPKSILLLVFQKYLFEVLERKMHCGLTNMKISILPSTCGNMKFKLM